MESKPIDINDCDKIMEIYNELLAKETELSKELNSITSTQNKLLSEHSAIETEIERINSEIEKAKKEKSSINEEQLNQLTTKTIDFFLKNVNSVDLTKLNLQIRLEYKQMTIIKTITDENLTFEKLKEETKLQFGKDADEFFFMDKEGNIFLDELKVVYALFPFTKVKVDKFEPVIRVVDKNVLRAVKDQVIIEPPEEIINETERKLTYKQQIKQYFQKNAKHLLFSLFYICFIACWSQSCLTYLQAKDYRTYTNSLKEFTYYMGNSQTLSFDIYDSLKQYFFDEESPFTHANIPIGQIRFVENIAKINEKCKSERYTIIDKEQCINIFSHISKKDSYSYKKTPSFGNIEGELNSHNNDGFVTDIPFTEEGIDKIDIKITKETISLLIILNFYNIHLNSINSYRILLENRGNNLMPFEHIAIVYLDQKVDGYLIASIILSLISIVLMLYYLSHKRTKENPLQTTSCCNRLIQKFKDNFNPFLPWNYILVINFLFYYAMIIFRYTYLGNFKDINLSQDEYIEKFQTLAFRNMLVSLLSGINLLIFYFILLPILNHYLREFKVITRTIKAYMFTMLSLFFGIIFPFLMITMYVSYFMFGDYYNHSQSYSKRLTFIFLKTIQIFFRGSFDYMDYSIQLTELARNTALTNNSVIQIIDKVGPSGYIIYSLIHYFFTYVFIRGCVIGCCYLTYRDQYIQTLRDEEFKRKEKLRQERKKRKDEIQKLVEMNKKDNVKDNDENSDLIDSNQIELNVKES